MPVRILFADKERTTNRAAGCGFMQLALLSEFAPQLAVQRVATVMLTWRSKTLP
jgi:hypothetical protein